MEATISFTDPTCTGERAGGKGANLGRLTAAGLPVPGGFVVPTDVYARFVDESGIRAELLRMVGGLDDDDAATLETQTRAIRDLVLAADMPDEIRRDVTSAYEHLGADRYVAVRSSRTAEDLAGASFAGLHDRYLDIVGSPAVVDLVKRCWASMWTARATSYRRASRLRPHHGEHRRRRAGDGLVQRQRRDVHGQSVGRRHEGDGDQLELGAR
jgi:phosphoenolpyruvate synthase/pyruvate phosphate dikinase